LFTRNDFHYFIEPLIDPEEEAKIKKKMITLIETVHERLPRRLRELLRPGISKLNCEWGYLTEKEPPVYSVHYNVVIGVNGISVGVAIESVKLLPKFLKKLAKNKN